MHSCEKVPTGDSETSSAFVHTVSFLLPGLDSEAVASQFWYAGREISLVRSSGHLVKQRQLQPAGARYLAMASTSEVESGITQWMLRSTRRKQAHITFLNNEWTTQWIDLQGDSETELRVQGEMSWLARLFRPLFFLYRAPCAHAAQHLLIDKIQIPGSTISDEAVHYSIWACIYSLTLSV